LNQGEVERYRWSAPPTANALLSPNFDPLQPLKHTLGTSRVVKRSCMLYNI
jgi:hypothetical protein